MPIDSRRSRQIHALKRQIGMSDEQYRDMLRDGFGVTSSLNLPDNVAADQLILSLRQAAGQTLYLAKPLGKKYDDLGGRSGYYATPKQLRMLEVMWAGVSRAKPGKDRERALNTFLGRFGVKSLPELPRRKVQAVYQAIRVMQQARDEAAAGKEVSA